jgi:predicted ATPase/class 3 adenylate cyclase
VLHRISPSGRQRSRPYQARIVDDSAYRFNVPVVTEPTNSSVNYCLSMGALVSLVMSDIVDSTRRWNAAEGAMAADLEVHDRLIRDVVEGAGGSVFKHTGDGMIAVFDDPVAAAGAAAGVQQAIGAALWQQPDGLRVRAAVHTGVVYPRDGDLFGTAVNKVARLLGVCPAGAVLVSGATTVLLADRAPEGLSLQPIGPVELAGFGTPDDAHALVGTWLAAVPAVAAVAAEPMRHATAVPSIHDELVGRSDELAAVWEMLGRSQVLTVVGVGGMGKTRLALEVAAGAVAAYDGAVWWIDLANATGADAVVPVAMAAVGAQESPGRTPVESLCDRFSKVSGVVVVDNCEHVLAAARAMVSAVRDAAPGVRLVCTSREALGLRGEQILPIGSLPADDGVTLFCERAVTVRPDIDLDAYRSVIERICARLDGIPLAIELAAARCRSMTPAEIDSRLDDRFRLLRGGRDGAERHRTLQAAVAWSCSLLDPDEQTVFDQMAVFAGGTLIDGLAAVTGLDEFDALDILDRLVARSMVVATTTRLGTRYHQLETLRQFGEDRLVEAGTIGDVRDRHLGWVHRLAAQLFFAKGLEAEATALARFAADIDNLRVGVGHAIATDRHPTAHEVVAMIGTLAVALPSFEPTDWVQPIQLDNGWTEAAATCEAFASWFAHQRNPQSGCLESADELPDWFHLAPEAGLVGVLGVHLISGGSWRVAVDVLERCEPTSERHRVHIDAYRMLASFVRQLDERPSEEEVDHLLALAASIADRARASGSALFVSNMLLFAAMGLQQPRPARAADYAREALDLGERLGSGFNSSLALALLVGTADSVEPSLDLLIRVRHDLARALDAHLVGAADSLAWMVLPLIAPTHPDTVVRFVAVEQREFPGVAQGLLTLLDRVDIAVPDDLESIREQMADVSLADAMRGVLAALDRVIAAAEAAAAGAGDS